MTLKKFLKRVSGDELIEIYDPNPLGTKLHFGYKKEVDPHYMDMVVKSVFAYRDRLCINVKEPKHKRSTNNKAYKDGGYAGDNADNDKPCEYAMKCPITGTFHCVKWMFTECDCEYMRIESPVCAYCDKQIER